MVLFTRGRPTASELLQSSQSLILNNFNSSDTSFGVDHFQFSDPTAANGAHKQVQLQETTMGAIPATLIGIGYETLYASTTGLGGQLFYVQGNNMTGVQLTGPLTPTNLSATNGYTFMAGGFLLQWGQVTTLGATHQSGNASFNVAFPNDSFIVVCTPLVSGSGITSLATVSVNSSNANGFNWVFNQQISTNYGNFTWIATGF